MIAYRMGAVLAALVMAGLPQRAVAEAPRAPHILTVTGEGEVRAVPDRAQLTAGVVTHAKTAAEALAQNSDAMARVMAALKKSGVPEKSIATSNFSIQPQYPPYRQDAPDEDRTRIIGYEAGNQVTVTVDDVSKVGTILDALVSAGANQTGVVSFTFRDPKPLLKQAREEAVKDAIDKARTLAKAAGVTLGPIISIQEGFAALPSPMIEQRMMAVAAPAYKAPPIAAGEQTISTQVNIAWEIP